MMTRMTTDPRVRRLRLLAQHIDGSTFTTPAEVVRWMLAMQGQDLPGAKWSVGLRAPGSTLADVDAALASGAIIRSWPMRGTLHLVPAGGHRLDARPDRRPDAAVADHPAP